MPPDSHCNAPRTSFHRQSGLLLLACAKGCTATGLALREKTQGIVVRSRRRPERFGSLRDLGLTTCFSRSTGKIEQAVVKIEVGVELVFLRQRGVSMSKQPQVVS